MRLTPVMIPAAALLATTLGCTTRPTTLSATATKDSLRVLLAAYEHDQITLEAVSQRLADLLETPPPGSLMMSGSITPKTREALDSADRVLYRRRYGRRP
jgi:hypothetical protein